MNKALFAIYRVVVPKPFRTRILKKNLRRKILAHFAEIPDDKINEDQKEVLSYLMNNPVSIFPYPFQNLYLPVNVEVLSDLETGMKYVNQDGKRLYFKKRWNIKRIQKGYCDLAKEQDVDSPHRYISDYFSPGSNDVLADIGAAEGNFSLSVIEKVRKAYLFEYDPEWIEALRKTFVPWKDKVEIVPKYVGDSDDRKHMSLDSFFENNNDVTFLKIDVEGAEQKVLNGCKSLFESKIPLKIAICTYHNNNDEKDFASQLLGYGFKVSFSKGYMINYYDKKIKAPWLRRGLIKAVRE
jgi:hypothetical protein